MRTMRLVAGFLTMICLNFTTLQADEESIPLDQVPKAILEAAKKRFPKAEITEAAKETDKDKVEYEITLKDGKAKIDAMFSPEGKLLLIEKTIDVKMLPQAVTGTLEKKYPKATYKLAEEVTKVTDGKEAIDFYEVLLVAGDKKVYEVQITSDGKIKEVEEKKSQETEEKKK